MHILPDGPGALLGDGAGAAGDRCTPTTDRPPTGKPMPCALGTPASLPSLIYSCSPPWWVSRTFSLERWSKGCPGGGTRQRQLEWRWPSRWSPQAQEKPAPSKTRALGCRPGGPLTRARSPVSGAATAACARSGGRRTSSATVRRWVSSGQWGPLGWVPQALVGHGDHPGRGVFLAWAEARPSWEGGPGENSQWPGLPPPWAARPLPVLWLGGAR